MLSAFPVGEDHLDQTRDDERGLDITSQQLRIIKTEERFVENDSGNLVQFNFARINKNGTVDFKGWSGSLGVSYKEKLASLGKGWTFVGNEVDYNTNVRNASGDRIKLDELLEIKDDWLNLVDRTLELFKASLRDKTPSSWLQGSKSVKDLPSFLHLPSS